MSKFCGNCGAQLEDNVKVCGYCGTPCVTTETIAEKATKKHSGKSKKIIVSIVAVIAVFVGIFSFSSFSNGPCDWCGNSPLKHSRLRVEKNHMFAVIAEKSVPGVATEQPNTMKII